MEVHHPEQTAAIPQEKTNQERDLLLVDRISTGDHAAFDLLISLYDKPMRTIIRSMLKNQADIDEMMQNIHLKLWLNLYEKHSYTPRPDSKFSLWLQKVVRNEGINYLRKERRPGHYLDANRAKKESKTPETTEIEGEDDTEQTLWEGERNKLLIEAMDRVLKPEEKQILILRYVDGVSFKEIAAQLGINIGTVQSRGFRAQEKLKAELGQNIEDFLGKM